MTFNTELVYRPILMTGDMVRATLDDRKTNTRRIVKDAPVERDGYLCTKLVTYSHEAQYRKFAPTFCPYGKVGDYLWVKETFWSYDTNPTTIRLNSSGAGFRDDKLSAATHSFTAYRASWGDKKPEGCKAWKPSIFMPRRLSRLTLEITDVSVERLQEISAGDAISEGAMTLDQEWIAKQFPTYAADYAQWKRIGLSNIAPPIGPGPVRRFRALWESINGAKSWDVNPFVWVIAFRMVQNEFGLST